jgi:hypothetical protein
MNTEEIIEDIKRLLEKEECNGVVAVQKDDNISLVARGNENTLGACLITLLGTDRLGNHSLSIIAAYCLAKANGFKEFKNPNRFAEHLTNCAQLYAQMQGDKTFS